DAAQWVEPAMRPAVLRLSDGSGLARSDAWHAGTAQPVPDSARAWLPNDGVSIPGNRELAFILDAACNGKTLTEQQIVRLFQAQGAEIRSVLQAADQLRKHVAGDTVTYVVNRNINYTNICMYHCEFCAFAKGQGAQARQLRGAAYRLDFDDIAARAVAAHRAGATEVCLQGGIHPAFTGQTYLDILAAVKAAVPTLHVHAFSPLEITHGANTLGLSLRDYLRQLQQAGLATLPGTAAEILSDDVRQIICPDKLDKAGWLDVMRQAHTIGLRSTATIMFGHVDQPHHWARHLLLVRELQQHTGGFTEFVPLPFVHMEAPLWRRGTSRSGPTLRESLLMHAVSRLVLHPHIRNIQTSWVKMGREGAAFCLQAGANDLGGTLLNESITRAAGGVNGQEMGFAEMAMLAASIDRPSRQRTTLYQPVERQSAETNTQRMQAQAAL